MAKKTWSHSIMSYGESVRVEEKYVGGPIILVYRENGKRKRRSLGTRNREEAKAAAFQFAHEQQRRGGSQRLRLGHLLRQYIQQHSDDKEDERRFKLWTTHLGSDFLVDEMSQIHWSTFAKKRMAGEIDAKGEWVKPKERKTLRARTAAADLAWLRSACRWGVRARLLDSDPTAGLQLPARGHQRRPVMTRARLDKLREVAHEDLADLLTVLAGTGRRLGSVVHLQPEDVHLEETPAAPYGSVTWSHEHDKQGVEWARIPISPDVREVLERRLDGEWIFPAPRDASKPLSPRRALRWLEAAEKTAELPPMEGSAFHSIRRLFAVERKHLPPSDVAAAGGWTSPSTVLEIYTQADSETVLATVLNE